MKLQRVRFNREEAAWYSRNVIKSKELLEEKAKRDPAIVERLTYKLVSKMQEQALKTFVALAGSAEEYDVMLKRKERMILREMVQKMHDGLKQATIPKYERDGDKAEYLARAIEKAKLLNGMARKLK